MSQTIARGIGQQSKSYVEGLEAIYQQLNSIPNTIICLQYDATKFLTFRVNEASRGCIVRRGLKDTNIAFQCQIRRNAYIFTREHLEQLNHRECRDLFNQLGFTEFISLFS